MSVVQHYNMQGGPHGLAVTIDKGYWKGQICSHMFSILIILTSLPDNDHNKMHLAGSQRNTKTQTRHMLLTQNSVP